MPERSRHSGRTARLAGWGLGVIFVGLLLAGSVAWVLREDKGREVRVEVKAAAISSEVESPVLSSSGKVRVRPDSLPIADPVVRRLFREARQARSDEDIALTLVKLSEAREMAPAEPNVLYETGLLFDEMSVYDERLADQATEAYQAVFKLGADRAGVFYAQAAEKLRDGPR